MFGLEKILAIAALLMLAFARGACASVDLHNVYTRHTRQAY
ncbi:hypothetical protein K788_00036720 [Paraburkholderia caribensis MBA4]|uniref:Uncharacterized protein n=1 Tax=Paraburkholderia caribensis MBA4 TaxID=1323664 RepID=A0A0N7JVI3_9BURK|nr:hypothetical protein K788_00036720 [Paraburkholderia caribensis MBA4]